MKEKQEENQSGEDNSLPTYCRLKQKCTVAERVRMIERPAVYSYLSHACDPYRPCVRGILKFNNNRSYSMLCCNTFIRTPVPLRGHVRSNPLLGLENNNSVAASFLLTLGKCKDSHDRLEKTLARWTVNTAIVLRCFAPSAQGILNWGWWNTGGGGEDCGLHWRWQGWTGYLLPT